MAKKFNYKLPSMVALTLVGSAVTAHQVQAAETTQDQTTNKNVLDSNKVKATTEQAKAEVKNPTQNISGTQVYQDPAIVQPKAANKTGNAQVNQKVDTTQVNGDTRATQSTTSNNAKPVTKTTNTTAPKTNNNVTSAGYSLVDDEDDNSENQINPELIKSAAKPAALETQYKAAAPKATPVAPKAKTEVTPKVTTFSASAQPRSAAAAPKTSLPKYKPQVNSSINDYIRKNNLKAPKIEEDYTSYFPKYAYRNGVGRPEGIVVHDTANDRSTINGEISYMKNNYQNAFVHAFVDGDRIIETAPTDYLSWGVGAVGNPRFINVEIVHTHDYASFARSMNNYADYAATQLQYYGLKPDSAEYDGNGTVWTHYAVSKYLGGTDHADPHGYLRSHNYSYDQLYDLINEKYLIKMGKVAPWGTQSTTTPTTPSKPSTGKLTVAANNGVAQIKPTNSGLYTTVYDKTGKATNEVQKTFAVSKTATLGNQKFYLVQDYNSGNKFGWVKEGDVVYNTAKSPVNGKSGWISKAYLAVPAAPKKAVAQPKTAVKAYAVTKPQTTQTVSKIAQVKPNNTGIRASVYEKTAKNGAKYADRTFYVTKERAHGNETYVLLNNTSHNIPLGWFNVKDLNVQNLGKEVKTTQKYTVNKSNNGLSMVPWGTKNQVILTGDHIAQGTFNAAKQVSVGKDVYLYGTINNRTGWVNAKDLTAPTAVKPNTSAAKDYNYTYVIKNGNGYYYVTPNSDTAKYSLKAFNEQPFSVVKEQVINGQTWYYGKLSNGKLAWIKSTDLAKELIKYNQTGMTLNQVAQIQAGLQYKPQVQRVPGKWTDANFNDVKHAMDTKRLAQDPALKYQFLRLDQPQNISIDKINQFLKGKGVLENQGAAFNKAAQMYGINEVYLISHALLETGNGTSQLAKGADVVNNKVVTNSNTKYHNVFGIAAYDNDPLREGIKYAKQAGWDTVSKAIVGGAKFIGNSYVKAGQNTLYKMRWNPAHPGTHQYATDVDWANINAKIIKGYYDKIGEVGKYFDIPQYK
ncbi:TPA: glucosaminidase domain-containing protein [Staphylococcus aureus]|uniref:glucosaminidase domain-containing protein n=1 Tax=Staphylococcus aureus TaxID=1280 RepID=UPI000446BD1B|nr:glucosaminidase domain-containing protein [Staphylococcus aureus]KAI82880.1 bifunctional autolysin [Staphylococcus aureus ZTA10/02412-8HSA]HDK9151716.1 glucosaminidase domain-containing protein [Staphylococcus aureus]